MVALAALSISATPFVLGCEAAVGRAVHPHQADAQWVARSTEARCGYQPGTALIVPDAKTIMLRPLGPETASPRFKCLFEAFGGMERQGIHVYLITEGNVR